ncbi:MAG: WbuC family cupin fold metalloprotein, partial [Bacteroides sp.]|nr:WbuC family cupin fold metalloprotein [Bacteroides sp.]
MKIIDTSLLDTVSSQAQSNPRLRMNYNFHTSMEEPIHRMLNAMEPGTFVPPHRHMDPDKLEVYIVLRGSLVAVEFDEAGNILQKVVLGPESGRYGLEIPARTWHSLAVLEPGTVIYEIKEGPFAPVVPENMAPWAPDPEDKEGIA